MRQCFFSPLAIYSEEKLLDHMVFQFLIFLRNFYTVFHSGCTSLHLHHWYIRVHLTPYFCQQLLYLVFFIIVIQIVVRCYLVLICTSMINDVEHLFMYLLTIYVLSLEKCVFSFSTHFVIKFFVVFIVIELYEFFLYCGY